MSSYDEGDSRLFGEVHLMPNFYLVYCKRPTEDSFAEPSKLRSQDMPADLDSTSTMTKAAALAEADRLLSTGEGFDPLLYEEGNDTEIMDTGAIRRVLGLDCSR